MSLRAVGNSFGAWFDQPPLPTIDHVPLPRGFNSSTLRESRRVILEMAARGELDRDEADYLLSDAP